MPSFRIALERWFSTVFSDRWRIAAISLVGVRLGDQLHHLLLARGQLLVARGALAEDVLDQGPLRLWREEGLAALDRAHRVEQVRVGLGLQHVARGPGLERLEQVALVVVHRQDQDRDVGRLGADLARGLQPGQLGHLDVEDRQVGSLADRHVAGLGAVGGLADHLDVHLALEQHPQAGAHDPVVVGDQHLHGCGSVCGVCFHRPHLCIGLSRNGTVRLTRVPTFGRDSTSHVAPDEQRPLAHAGDPQPASRLVEGEAGPVVADRQLDPVARRRGAIARGAGP